MEYTLCSKRIKVSTLIYFLTTHLVMTTTVGAVEFIEDYSKLRAITASGPCRTYTYQRLKRELLRIIN